MKIVSFNVNGIRAIMKKEFTITAYTENQVGLLNRIAIIFSKRKTERLVATN